ncbi:MAG: hypothetical protein NVS9B9_01410 [Ktedonobacteraceae bacterium]
MSRFASASHLDFCAGVALGNKQSGGKRLKAHTNKSNTHVRAVLAEVVWVISHTKDSYGTIIVSVEFRYPRAKEMPIAPTSAIHTSYTCIL